MNESTDNRPIFTIANDGDNEPFFEVSARPGTAPTEIIGHLLTAVVTTARQEGVALAELTQSLKDEWDDYGQWDEPCELLTIDDMEPEIIKSGSRV